MRQISQISMASVQFQISKLPMRQISEKVNKGEFFIFSKLPMRQIRHDLVFPRLIKVF